MTEGGCLAPELPIAADGQVACMIAKVSPSPVDCSQAGREELPPEALELISCELEETGVCGGSFACSDWVGCSIQQLTGDQKSECQSNASDPSAFDSAGFCYIDDASSPVLAGCPASSKGSLRAVGAGMPRDGHLVFLFCEGESTAEIDNLLVGQACIPEELLRTDFSGYSQSEVNLDKGHQACASGLCLANHFQGRPSCPYGQNGNDIDNESPNSCLTPEGERVEVGVAPQVNQRRAEDTVICSCRCDGPDPDAEYCTCPSGTICEPLIDDLGFGSDDSAGSYCIKEGTAYDSKIPASESCDASLNNCGP